METISTFNQVKLHNVTMIKNTLRSIPNGTKHTVAQMTGLSIATCNTILNELAETGEILPVEASVSYVGRPPKLFRFNKDYSYICCLFPAVDSGKEYLNYAIVDLLGNILTQRSLGYDKICFDTIADLLRELIKKEPRIETISIGIPGYHNNGVVESCGIEELNGYRLAEKLQEEFHRTVLLENNMNAIAYGLYSANPGLKDSGAGFVTISFFKDSGPGSGIILNGEIIRGSTNFAGEILYLPYAETDIHELVKQGDESIIECAVTALICYCIILNPALVVFTGENLSERMIPAIQEKCLKTVPAEHLPDLRYEKDYMDSYISGLTQTAFDNLF